MSIITLASNFGRRNYFSILFRCRI